MDCYDVIIIGTGAGGGTLARHLAPSGKRILLLERGDWLPREPRTGSTQAVFVDNRYVSPDTWYDENGQAVPAAGALLRRRRDEALRRGPLPAPEGGLRRAPPPRRQSRRPGRSPTTSWSRTTRWPSSSTRCTAPAARTRPSRRRARRIRIPAVSARAADPAALGRPRRGRLPPVPRALRDHARRGEHAVQRRACAARRATASPASSMPSPTPRCSACGPRSSIRTSRC